MFFFNWKNTNEAKAELVARARPKCIALGGKRVTRKAKKNKAKRI